MKTSLDWLNSYLDRPADADEVEQLLTDQGLPIESRETTQGGDVVLDVEVTSNRSDCLSHVGLAREVAAGSGRALVGVQEEPLLNHEDSSVQVGAVAGVENQNENLCPLYTARVIRGVKVGDSPDWLVKRLEAVGLRAVNNIVDVTNYVLLELGQPLHAFDMAKLKGQRIVVRGALEGESIEAIDGSRHELKAGMGVIADENDPVAIAGVMGGMASRVTQSTVDVLLESAVFDPLSVRGTGRSLKLTSDSSYRFERGVDPQGVDQASRRAAGLICQLTGGTLARGVICIGKAAPDRHDVVMRIERCCRLLGVELEAGQIVDLLTPLGFEPRLEQAGQQVVCSVPSYRLDISREVDLIEEVARLYGFDAVPVNEKIHIVARPVQPRVAARRKLGEVLVGRGYYEAVTFSFIRVKQGELFVGDGHEAVRVEDERRKAEPMLRPSVLPSLLACRKSNQDVGNTKVRLYECAAVWAGQKGRVVERRCLGMVGDAGQNQEALREIKGVIGELVQRLMGAVEPVFVPGERANFSVAAMVQAGGYKLGWVGLISQTTQELFDLQHPLVAAELDLDILLDGYPPERRVRELARFPGIERDLSVIVEDGVGWDKIQEQVLAGEPALLEDIRFLGIYRGKPVESGKKSVSIRMVFRDPAGTLRHEQVDPQVAAVVQRLETQLGARLRG